MVNKDGKKIALAIEGGGMRGCVAAGMVTVSFTHDSNNSNIIIVIYSATILQFVYLFVCLSLWLLLPVELGIVATGTSGQC